jgi:hypothetical protein
MSGKVRGDYPYNYAGHEPALVTVGVFANEFDAALAKSVLEGAGIESIVSGDDCGGMEKMMGSMGIKVMVRTEDAERAKEYLKGVEGENE